MSLSVAVNDDTDTLSKFSEIFKCKHPISMFKKSLIEKRVYFSTITGCGQKIPPEQDSLQK